MIYNVLYLGECPLLLAFQMKTPFVDATTISVDYTVCIGKGSYGIVHRGSYQGTPAAVKIVPVGVSSTASELIIPGYVHSLSRSCSLSLTV